MQIKITYLHTTHSYLHTMQITKPKMQITLIYLHTHNPLKMGLVQIVQVMQVKLKHPRGAGVR